MKSFKIRRGLVLAGAASAWLLGALVPTLSHASAATSGDDSSLAPCADFIKGAPDFHYGDSTSGPNGFTFVVNLAGPVDKGCRNGTYVLYLYDQTYKCSVPGVPVADCIGVGTIEIDQTNLLTQTTYAAKSVRGQTALTYNYCWSGSGCFTGSPPGSQGPSDALCVGAETVASTGKELDGAPTSGTDWTHQNPNACLVLPYNSGGSGGNSFY